MLVLEKQLYSSLPHKIYTGYKASPRPSKFPNTNVNTIVVSNGSNKVHTKPKYDLLYFSLIPLITNSFKRNLYRMKLSIYFFILPPISLVIHALIIYYYLLLSNFLLQSTPDPAVSLFKNFFANSLCRISVIYVTESVIECFVF